MLGLTERGITTPTSINPKRWKVNNEISIHGLVPQVLVQVLLGPVRVLLFSSRYHPLLTEFLQATKG